MASLFTSLYPRSHGVLHGFALAREVHGQEMLDSSLVTLAEALKRNGYVTFGVAGTGHVSRQAGMTNGFDHLTELWFTQNPSLHNALLDLKSSLRKTSSPFFLWVHYFNPHSPYNARKPWIDHYARHPKQTEEFASKQMEWLQTQIPRIKDNPDIIETLVDLYDSEINYTDSYIKRLFDEVLPTKNTLVIITADHGEAFMDHGLLGHANSLFEEELRIPLIIIPPASTKFKASAVSGAVCNIDIYPTILNYLRIEQPSPLQGQSLSSLLDGNPPPTDRVIFAELDRGQSLKSVAIGNWKLIADPAGRKPLMLFDLASDPKEARNILEEQPEVAARLNGELDRWMDRTEPFTAPRGTVHLTPEQEKTLKSLGYLK